MILWYYTARKRFSPSTADGWQSYLDFSGFHDIVELISADQILCPNLIDDIVDDDWDHNVQTDYRIDWFLDCDYLIRRVNFDSRIHNLLALREQPLDVAIVPAGFEQCGFDILDSYDSISVLTNCGQFSSVFKPSEVNQYGLLEDLARANTVADNLRMQNSGDPHCKDCKVWQIARYVEGK